MVWRRKQQPPRPQESPKLLAGAPLRLALVNQHLLIVAKAAGVSRGYLKEIRDGTFVPTPETKAKIEQAIQHLKDDYGMMPDLLEWTRAESAKIGAHDLACQAGVSYLALARYLSGRRDPAKFRTAQKLAKYRKKMVGNI